MTQSVHQRGFEALDKVQSDALFRFHFPLGVIHSSVARVLGVSEHLPHPSALLMFNPSARLPLFLWAHCAEHGEHIRNGNDSQLKPRRSLREALYCAFVFFNIKSDEFASGFLRSHQK